MHKHLPAFPHHLGLTEYGLSKLEYIATKLAAATLPNCATIQEKHDVLNMAVADAALLLTKLKQVYMDDEGYQKQREDHDNQGCTDP